MKNKCSCCGSSDIFKYSDDSAFERYVCKNCGHVDYYMTDYVEFIRRRETLLIHANHLKDFALKYALNYKPYIERYFNMIIALLEKEVEILSTRVKPLQEELDSKNSMVQSIDITIRQHDELLKEIPEIEKRIRKANDDIHTYKSSLQERRESSHKYDDLLRKIEDGVLNHANVVDDPYASFWGIRFEDPDKKVDYEPLENQLKEEITTYHELWPFNNVSVDKLPEKMNEILDEVMNVHRKYSNLFSDEENIVLEQIINDYR